MIVIYTQTVGVSVSTKLDQDQLVSLEKTRDIIIYGLGLLLVGFI